MQPLSSCPSGHPALPFGQFKDLESQHLNLIEFLLDVPQSPHHPWDGMQILFEETLYQKAKDGSLLVNKLRERGIILGIKVRA